MLRLLMILVISGLTTGALHSQILISLIFGDKLNSEGLEFGIDGGLVFTDIANLPDSKSDLRYNLGFYFDITLNEKKNMFIHTGLIVVSPAGARKLEPYTLNDPDLDFVLQDTDVRRKLRYFHVPVLFRYRFPPYIFIEAGPQAGLINRGQDVFYKKLDEKDEIYYVNSIRSNYNPLEFGMTGGIGYKFLKGEGISVGGRYYMGLTNILKDKSIPAQYNRIGYLYVSIPIGAHKENKE